MPTANRNLQYRSEQMVRYYSSHRASWAELYPSERWVFERIERERGSPGSVLDVGCACGGLGAALEEKALLAAYTGVDLHRGCIEWARQHRRLAAPARFLEGDILQLHEIPQHRTVVTLGVPDWNVESARIIQRCWELVEPGGSYVCSLRLTPEKTVEDLSRSYQRIEFFPSSAPPEIASYVVMNFTESLDLFARLSPAPGLIGAYGYWGKPSPTAVTPYEQVLFAVFFLFKVEGSSRAELHLPLDLVRGETR